MDFLKKKVFGVPVLYIGGLFVAILAFLAWRMKPNMTSAADGSTDTDGTNTDAITGDDNPYDMFKTTGTVTVQQGSDPATVTPVGNRTNDAWARTAADWLRTTQGVSATTALDTMMKFVNGEQLSLPEGQLRDKAIAQFGYPPEAFTIGGTAAAPPPATTPGVRQGSPPLVHKVTGTGDNDFAKIATLYFKSGQDYTNFVAAHNTNLPEGTANLTTGTGVKVPAYESKTYKIPAGKQMDISQVASANGMSVEMFQRLNNNPPAEYVYGPGRVVRVR